MIRKIINKLKRIFLPYFVIGKKKKLEKCALPFDKHRGIIIFETSFGWDKIMKQRPQQLALGFDESFLVLYHSAKDTYDSGLYMRKLKDNLYLLNNDIYRKNVALKCREYSEKYVVIYSTDPSASKNISFYKKEGFRIIYEYVDDINPQLCSLSVYKKLKRNFDLMMAERENTVCTATRLYNNVEPLTRASLVTNGCDYGHFKASSHEVPPDMVISSGKPVIGYYGALAAWFDYKLIEKLSKSGKYEIVLIGVSYDGSLEKSGVCELEQVHYLGKKDYEDLPRYVSNIDVMTIPFLINDLTASTSPVKLFEYMAAEKPIVTTDLAECRKYGSVFAAKDHDEFLELIDKAVSLKDDKDQKELLRNEALRNTWDAKCRDIISFMRSR